jgi:hypothetical protein
MSTFQDWIDDQSLNLNDATFNKEMKIHLYKLTVRKKKIKIKNYQIQWNWTWSQLMKKLMLKSDEHLWYTRNSKNDSILADAKKYEIFKQQNNHAMKINVLCKKDDIEESFNN